MFGNNNNKALHLVKLDNRYCYLVFTLLTVSASCCAIAKQDDASCAMLTNCFKKQPGTHMIRSICNPEAKELVNDDDGVKCSRTYSKMYVNSAPTQRYPKK